MAAVLDLTRSPAHLPMPAPVGVCEHCGQTLYAQAPIADHPLAHIACATFVAAHGHL